MITRAEAYVLLKKYNKDPFHIQHSLTVEAVMKWYAKELGYGEDEETDASIIIKNKGTDLSEQGQYPSREPYSAIPYVVDLLKIRGKVEKRLNTYQVIVNKIRNLEEEK